MPCDLRLTQNKLSQMLLLLLSKLIFQEIYTLIQDNTVQLAGLGLEPTYFLILLRKVSKETRFVEKEVCFISEASYQAARWGLG